MTDTTSLVPMCVRVFGDEWLKLTSINLGDCYMLRVVEQKWRGYAFAPWADSPQRHTASVVCEEFVLLSEACPAANASTVMFVRGRDTTKDESWLGPVDKEWFERCVLVVKDYNEKAAWHEESLRVVKLAEPEPAEDADDKPALVLQVETHADGRRLIGVVEQSSRGADFAPDGGRQFMASNGFRLMSYAGPNPNEDGMYVRGHDSRFDDDMEHVPSDEWLARLRVAVREYNEAWAAKRAESKAFDKIEKPSTEVIA